MPAIQIARLKIQSAQLAECFNTPSVFVTNLHELLDLYANRTVRPKQTGDPVPLIPSYNVPLPVLRQISIDLEPYIHTDPSGAIRLSDRLWQEKYLEFKTLAITVLGSISPDPSLPIFERVRAWANPLTEKALVELILDEGLRQVRKKLTENFLHEIKILISSEDWLSQQMGLQAILPLIMDEEFGNLPVLFSLISPVLKSFNPALRPDLLKVLVALANRSPRETAYFLRQALLSKDYDDVTWLIRRTLPSFSVDLQASLREALRTTRAAPSGSK
jgi:hypothetical protein